METVHPRRDVGRDVGNKGRIGLQERLGHFGTLSGVSTTPLGGFRE